MKGFAPVVVFSAFAGLAITPIAAPRLAGRLAAQEEPDEKSRQSAREKDGQRFMDRSLEYSSAHPRPPARTGDAVRDQLIWERYKAAARHSDGWIRRYSVGGDRGAGEEF